MGQYQYVAKSSKGETLGGTMQAESAADARQRLRQQGLFVLSLSAETAPRVRPSSGALFRKRVSRRELLMLTSQLSILVGSGIDLAEALRTAASQCTHRTLKGVLDQVYRDVSDGSTASAAFRKHPHVFDDAFVATIAAGEAAGKMREVLQRLSELLRNDLRVRSAVVGALTYPVALVVVASVVVTILLLCVLPQFAGVFESMQIPLPTATRVMLALGSGLQSWFWIWAPALAISIFTLCRYWNAPALCRGRDWLTLQCAGFRDITRPLLLGRVSRLLGMMLQSGIPLLEALRLCRMSIRNSYYQRLFADLESSVLGGSGIGRLFTVAPFVPGSAAQMIVAAEKTGTLSTVLQMVGEFYEEDGQRRLQEMAKLLEPSIIVVMGGVVGSIVFAVMGPIFEIAGMSS